ncbi:MAG: HAMP domain-containing protein [Acidobacteria bacterium]|nr:MAG: HAMP domain-containing protein [Acidobacteriota bacterium]
MRPRWERDNRILLGIGAALGLALAGLYALTLRARALSTGTLTNRVLLFVLFYIVVVLILALVFVIGRSGLKLLLESRRGVFGSRFRARVVATHVGLALLPIALLLLPITGLLQRSVDFWFEAPVAETVRSGREVSDLVRQREASLERRAAEALAGPLAGASDRAGVVALLSRARAETGLDYLEWRPAGEGEPVAVSSPRWPVREAGGPTAEWIAEARERGVARRTETTDDGGQASRSLVALPSGLLFAGTYTPPAEAVPLRALARATSTYAMLQAERASLKAVQVLFFLLLAFVVLLAAVWIGLLLARRVTRPIGALAASARRVGAGDFDVRVAVEGEDEIGALGSAFNSMTGELKASRERLVSANAEMAAANRRLAEERQRIRAILAHLGAGVLAFSADPAPEVSRARLLALNDAARGLLRLPGSEEPPDLCSLLAPAWLAPLREFLCRAFSAASLREATLTLVPPGEKEGLVLEARVAGVPGSEEVQPAWVVTLEDTTALVRAERAAAWEEAARRMAHEIKNPLTPIRLAAERMARKARAARQATPVATEPVLSAVEEGAAAIVEEVRTLSGLVDAFGHFARLPAADLKPTDLGAIVQQVVTLFSASPGVRVTSEVPAGLPEVQADAEQLKRALLNLVDNAVAASQPRGAVVVTASVEGSAARLTVADDGPGIPPEDRDRVFDPAFSTKPRGTGLGLSITARIAAEHRGRVWVEENRPRGCRFLLEWPAA